MSSQTVSAASNPERMFLSSLPLIDRVVAIQARRHALSAADAEDFGSWAKARLMDGDYAVFRKFGGRSSLPTYLTTVLVNLFRDYRNSRWGRWRPSAAAKRLGPVAIRLESLLYRDRYPMREAAQILRSSGVTLDDGEIGRLAASFPERQPTGEISLDAVPQSEAGALADPAAAPGYRDEAASQKVERALLDLVAELPPEDGLILRMRFWDDRSVADVARTLRLDQKALYRRIERIQERLRAALETRGIDRSLASDFLSGDLPW
ncbi:MAG TPA: sigma-70 family RNA polymerase sigma factor [Gemmatimonadaceae bacterium]|nr:sigma-70 family RNA polymerase sigma factor [Gemmatimonadaceae bacterium]